MAVYNVWDFDSLNLYGFKFGRGRCRRELRQEDKINSAGYGRFVEDVVADVKIEEWPDIEKEIQFRGIKLPWLFMLLKGSKWLVLRQSVMETLEYSAHELFTLTVRGGYIQEIPETWFLDPQFQALTADWFARLHRGDNSMPIISDWFRDRGLAEEAEYALHFGIPSIPLAINR